MGKVYLFFRLEILNINFEIILSLPIRKAIKIIPYQMVRTSNNILYQNHWYMMVQTSFCFNPILLFCFD